MEDTMADNDMIGDMQEQAFNAGYQSATDEWKAKLVIIVNFLIKGDVKGAMKLINEWLSAGEKKC